MDLCSLRGWPPSCHFCSDQILLTSVSAQNPVHFERNRDFSLTEAVRYTIQIRDEPANGPCNTHHQKIR